MIIQVINSVAEPDESQGDRRATTQIVRFGTARKLAPRQRSDSLAQALNLMFACAAKTTLATLALYKFIYNMKASLHHGHNN
jgi:hypothetical protein